MHLVFIDGRLVDPVFYALQVREVYEGPPRIIVRFEPAATGFISKVANGKRVRVAYVGPQSHWLDNGREMQVRFETCEGKEIEFKPKPQMSGRRKDRSGDRKRDREVPSRFRASSKGGGKRRRAQSSGSVGSESDKERGISSGESEGRNEDSAE